MKTMDDNTLSKFLEISTDFNYGNAANQINMLKGEVLHEQNFTGKGMQIAVTQMFCTQSIVISYCFTCRLLFVSTPLKIKPESPKAMRLPPGMERPQTEVQRERSLSVNHLLQNWVITL